MQITDEEIMEQGKILSKRIIAAKTEDELLDLCIELKKLKAQDCKRVITIMVKLVEFNAAAEKLKPYLYTPDFEDTPFAKRYDQRVKELEGGK